MPSGVGNLAERYVKHNWLIASQLYDLGWVKMTHPCLLNVLIVKCLCIALV